MLNSAYTDQWKQTYILKFEKSCPIYAYRETRLKVGPTFTGVKSRAPCSTWIHPSIYPPTLLA